MNAVKTERNDSFVKELVTDLVKDISSDNYKIGETHLATIETVIARKKLSAKALDYIVKKLLNVYKKNDGLIKGAIIGGATLGSAVEIAQRGASRKVCETLAAEMAKLGWYGRIREFTLKTLSRDLTAEEVHVMVDTYTNDFVSQSDDKEGWLSDAAQRSLPEEEIAEVKGKLKEFKREFNSHLD